MTTRRGTIRSTIRSQGGGIAYTFNGTNQYATHAAWNTLGDSTAYPPLFRFTTDNPDGYIVDETLPVTEFGRVGANYHQGKIRNLQYIDTSPLHGRYGVQTTVSNNIVLPDINLINATITFDMIYASTGAHNILRDSSSLDIILSVDASDVLAGGTNVTALLVDGSAYDSSPLVDGQHYRIAVSVSEGELGRLIGTGATFGSFTIYTAL